MAVETVNREKHTEMFSPHRLENPSNSGKTFTYCPEYICLKVVSFL